MNFRFGFIDNTQSVSLVRVRFRITLYVPLRGELQVATTLLMFSTMMYIVTISFTHDATGRLIY